MIGLFSEPERLACSRAGCSETAVWRIEWRNPKIHSADRVKVWLACEDHREYLENFLASRDFPVTVLALTPEDAP
ncbi:hypothetical protein ACLRGF_15290 [Mycetocola zhadangensis]|jgi:hypothetical protein|uniref:hypothetical protein n=1 Tax=Mycetocola zhadangensis TaxID=1164595 RepID=UPI003A4D4369